MQWNLFMSIQMHKIVQLHYPSQLQNVKPTDEKKVQPAEPIEGARVCCVCTLSRLNAPRARGYNWNVTFGEQFSGNIWLA